MRYALLLLTLPTLLAFAACAPEPYKGTKDAPDTCELCDDGTGDTGGTDGGTGGDTGGSDGGTGGDTGRTGGGSILSNPVQVSAGSIHTCALADSGVVCWGISSAGLADVP